jgi:hypothetical protein
MFLVIEFTGVTVFFFCKETQNPEKGHYPERGWSQAFQVMGPILYQGQDM